MNPQSRRMYPIISKNLVIHIMNIPRDRFIKIAKKLKSNRQKALKYSGYIMKYLVNSLGVFQDCADPAFLTKK